MTIEELIKILLSDKPSEELINNEEELFNLIPELKKCKGFNQNNPWHPYDVYNHILHVIDNTPNNIILRLCALFHDIGKPEVYKEDENGVGHFYNHWTISKEIFDSFSEKYNIENRKLISKLILYHDKSINEEDIKLFNKEEIELLFEFKKADLLAQSKEFHYILDDLENQKIKILKEWSD